MQYIGNCAQAVNLSHGLVFSLFIAGLIGGVTHCVSMCGPFVISQTGRMEKMSDGLLLPYHLGRMATYVFLAAVFYSILNLVFLFLPVRAYVTAPILLTASFLFLLNAFPKLNVLFPWTASIRLSIPYRFIAKLFERLSNRPNNLKKFAMGLLLGFMPCGMVTTALMASATAPDFSTAIMAMAAFALGTIPALTATAMTTWAVRLKYPHIIPFVTKGMMVWSSAWLFILAGITLIETR